MRRTVFGEAHEAFRAEVRELVRSELVPAYPEWEVIGRPDRRLWQRAGEIGILGIGVPQSYGGLPGSSFSHSVVVTEEIQREFRRFQRNHESHRRPRARPVGASRQDQE